MMARHERLVDVVGRQLAGALLVHDPSAIAATSSAGADHGKLVGSIVAHHRRQRVERRLHAVGVQP